MKIPPEYKITPEILELLAKIEANRLVFSSLEIPISVKDRIQRRSLLKSSLFSAKIEGNRLSMEDMNSSYGSKAIEKKEVFNLLKAVTYLEKEVKFGEPVNLDLILKLHSLVLTDISAEAGNFRTTPEAVFNQEGLVIYQPPPANDVVNLINQLVLFINSKSERFIFVKAQIAHLIFEKIHPFVDGNGRVGRLLISTVLKSASNDFNLIIPFEEYINEHKEEYYYYLDVRFKDTEKYLEFMLDCFYQETEKIKQEINLLSKQEKLLLPPRREEIYNIIKEHNTVTFDFIKRRFLAVPERTLRYDLARLVKDGLVVKIGRTKGSYYRAISI